MRKIRNTFDLWARQQMELLIVNAGDVGERGIYRGDQPLLFRVFEHIGLQNGLADAAHVFEIAQVLQGSLVDNRHYAPGAPSSTRLARFRRSSPVRPRCLMSRFRRCRDCLLPPAGQLQSATTERRRASPRTAAKVHNLNRLSTITVPFCSGCRSAGSPPRSRRVHGLADTKLPLPRDRRGPPADVPSREKPDRRSRPIAAPLARHLHRRRAYRRAWRK